MDETPRTFDMPNSTKIKKCGTHEKRNFTVILGCMADRTKLPLKLKYTSRELS